MKRYFETVLRHSVDEFDKYAPIYVVRYEDMVQGMEGPTRGILSYLLELEDMSGTNAERRIESFA